MTVAGPLATSSWRGVHFAREQSRCYVATPMRPSTSSLLGLIALAAAFLVACACEPPPGDGRGDAGEPDAGPMDAGSCIGCVAEDGGCETGYSNAACGRGALQCQRCPGFSNCINGRCEYPGGGCFAPQVPGAEWATPTCPATCPVGTVCLRGVGETTGDFGCVPIQPSCAEGKPSCACMGCLCAIRCFDWDDGGVGCDNGTVSSRQMKRDIEYVSDASRAELAAQALRLRLATYRYLTDPPASRSRLGFIIEDLPTGSPAVQSDRQHVDEYGYASLILAALQSQAERVSALERRIEELEASCPPPDAGPRSRRPR